MCFKALPWQPVPRFTGISEYTVDDQARVVKQVDFWDSINLVGGEQGQGRDRARRPCDDVPFPRCPTIAPCSSSLKDSGSACAHDGRIFALVIVLRALVATTAVGAVVLENHTPYLFSTRQYVRCPQPGHSAFCLWSFTVAASAPLLLRCCSPQNGVRTTRGFFSRQQQKKCDASP